MMPPRFSWKPAVLAAALLLSGCGGGGGGGGSSSTSGGSPTPIPPVTRYAYWKTLPTQAGVLSDPVGFGLGPNGLAAVADTANNAVVVIDPNGAVTLTLQGTILGPSARPRRSLRRRAFAPRTARARAGAISAPLQYITDAALGPDGSIYVADNGAGDIVVFSAQGAILRTVGGQGTGIGQFQNLYSVAVDSSGNIYGLDLDLGLVNVFDVQGNFVRAVGAGQIGQGSGIAVGPDGRLYVADLGGNEVKVFDAQGHLQKTLGSGPGAGNGQFSQPSGVAVDAQGSVYVADFGNDRIQKFDSSGSFLATVAGVTGQPGADNAHLNGPVDVALDPAGDVWIADEGNARLQVYQPQP